MQIRISLSFIHFLRNNRKFFILIVFVILALYLFLKREHYYPGSLSAKIDPEILRVYVEQTKLRKRLLQNLTDEDGFKLLYNVIIPEIHCLDLLRIGQVTDGGKWVCNPNRILEFHDCTIYSLGLNNDPSFDVEFQRFLHNKCKLRSFDKDAQENTTMKKLENANGMFMKALIANATNLATNQYTFRDIIKTFDDPRIDILKIDIEGNEFQISDEIISVPICQLLIEIHHQSPKQTLDLLKKFSKKGFYLFSYEINGQEHHLSEYSFLHESCFRDFGIEIIYGKYLS